MVCAGLTRREVDGAVDDAAGFAYDRAISISAAVPEALSFAPEPTPLLLSASETLNSRGHVADLVKVFGCRQAY